MTLKEACIQSLSEMSKPVTSWNIYEHICTHDKFPHCKHLDVAACLTKYSDNPNSGIKRQKGKAGKFLYYWDETISIDETFNQVSGIRENTNNCVQLKEALRCAILKSLKEIKMEVSARSIYYHIVAKKHFDFTIDKNYSGFTIYAILDECFADGSSGIKRTKRDGVTLYYLTDKIGKDANTLVTPTTQFIDTKNVTIIQEEENEKILHTDNISLAEKYIDKLNLGTLEVLWLNKFPFQSNLFLSSEPCCIATVKLYLLVLNELNKRFKKNSTSVSKEVYKLKAYAAKEYRNKYIGDIEAGIFITIFNRAENTARAFYKHQGKVIDTFINDVTHGNESNLSRKYESVFGGAVNEILATQRQLIIVNSPDIRALKELAMQDSLKASDSNKAKSKVLPGENLPRKKNINIVLERINEVKAEHSATADILGKIFNDDEIDIDRKQTDIPERHVQSMVLNEIQIALLHVFKEKELKVPIKEINSFAKDRNVFGSQLIDSINEHCYELFDDVLIEENGNNYSINKDYFNKILHHE